MNRTLQPLTALLLSGAPLLAQLTATPMSAPALTTGAVGLAASQTAQLSVVNLTPATAAISTTPFVPCQVQLEFWDTQGKLVKSGLTGNLAPGATFSLQLKLTEVTTNTSPLRTQIRGVVRQSQQVVTPTDSGEQAPAIPTFIPLSCAVATTLEVFDTTSGVTQTLTSDLHAMATFNILRRSSP